MQDAQQSDAAQQAPSVLGMLPAQQLEPNPHPSAPSGVTAASLSSHVVDATGHQHTAEPAAGEGLPPQAISPLTDQCASGADEPPVAVDAQPQHHTPGSDQSEAPASASTLTVDTAFEVTAVAPTASQPSTAGPGQSEASASASAHAVDTAAAQQLAPDACLPSTAISAQPSAEHAERFGDAAGTAGEHTASQAAVTVGVNTTADQQQSAGAQPPEQTSQIAAHTVLAEVDMNSQQNTARLGKRPALPPSNEPRLKRLKLNAAAEDEQEQQGGSEGPSPAGQDATRPMSAGEGNQGVQAVGRQAGEQGEAAPAAQAAPAMPLGSMPTGNSLPHAVCICCGSIVTGYLALAQQGRVYSDQAAFSCQSASRQLVSFSHSID